MKIEDANWLIKHAKDGIRAFDTSEFKRNKFIKDGYTRKKLISRLKNLEDYKRRLIRGY